MSGRAVTCVRGHDDWASDPATGKRRCRTCATLRQQTRRQRARLNGMQVPDPGEKWRRHAECRTFTPEYRTPTPWDFDSEDHHYARAVCRTPCPVLQACLTYGMRHGLSGVWGGTLLREGAQA